MDSQALSLSRHSFLGRRIFRHLREFHGDNKYNDATASIMTPPPELFLGGTFSRMRLVQQV